MSIYSARSIATGAKNISTALRDSSGVISGSIIAGADRIAESNIEAANIIAESIEMAGLEKAKAIMQMAGKLYDGLNLIANEMERKRNLDEYYFLIDRIEYLENKIIERGADLKQIYNGLEIEYRAPIEMSITDIRLLFFCCKDEEVKNTFKWICKASEFYCISPLDIFYDLLAKSRLCHDGGCDRLYAVPFGEYKNLELKLFLFTDMRYHVDIKKVQQSEGYALVSKRDKTEYPIKAFYYDDGRKKLCEEDIQLRVKSIYYSYQLDVDVDFKIAILRGIRKSFQSETRFSIEKMKEIEEFENFISRINGQIMLKNLRSLHSSLMATYKKLKLGEI